MKKLINISIAIVAAVILFVSVANAQFKGTIIYDVSAEGDLPQQTRDMMPKVLTYKYSDEKQSMSLDFALAEQRTIFDLGSKNAKVLMNLMGKKFAISQSASELDQLRKQDGLTVGVKETSETKNIAGYPCRKVILTKKKRDGKEIPSTLYYTDAIDVSKFQIFSAFPEIKGVPLEFSMKSGEMEFKVIARTVTKENIQPSEFAIGPEYQSLSMAELQKFFGSFGR